MVEIALLFVLSLSNSLVLVSFLCVSDQSHTQKQAGNMPSTQAAAPSPSHKSDGSEKVRMFDKRTHRHKLSIAKDSWASFGYATLNCTILRKYELLLASAHRQFTSASRQIGTGLIFFIQTFVDFALSLPGHSLWVCLHPGPWISFSETTKSDKKYKLAPNADFPDSFTAREVCEGMVTEITVNENWYDRYRLLEIQEMVCCVIHSVHCGEYDMSYASAR